MTTWQQPPVDSVQVPQTVGLSPEVAFNLVSQNGLAPMYQAQPIPGQAMPGIPTQWGQAPASFAGGAQTADYPATQIIAQNPVAGTWVPRGSVLYMEWAEVAPPAKKTSPLVWILVVLLAVLVLAALAYALLANGKDSKPKPSESPTATKTVTESASPQPTTTVTQTATATQTQNTTRTATSTATATSTTTVTPPP